MKIWMHCIMNAEWNLSLNFSCIFEKMCFFFCATYKNFRHFLFSFVAKFYFPGSYSLLILVVSRTFPCSTVKIQWKFPVSFITCYQKVGCGFELVNSRIFYYDLKIAQFFLSEDIKDETKTVVWHDMLNSTTDNLRELLRTPKLMRVLCKRMKE